MSPRRNGHSRKRERQRSRSQLGALAIEARYVFGKARTIAFRSAVVAGRRAAAAPTTELAASAPSIAIRITLGAIAQQPNLRS